ncbi:RsmD family RNA methyltransferase [Prolixibacter sp. NT017]|uniref:RsmD family RNA methyltransferase n=1 Tax=Prolixibacter sp. NT017 TaxID=2652390 RepID=UPI00127D7380|nr:RsmD family RNA methyltransferase [Prolixibacter sp. NT017]GET23794.1 methyltransferase [Prolixibacter sp. NT017]
MRIIGGEFKGRHFSPGNSFKARPTTDFARENLFNILIHRIDLDEISVLDLFGGTGSITLEFVSRGCEKVTCVEKNYRHFSFIQETIKKLGVEKAVHLIKGDVFRFIEKSAGKYDLVFADPPYDLPNLETLPELIFQHNLLNPGGIFILEHGKTNNFSSHPRFSELRKYGSVHFSIFSQEKD